MSRPLVSRMAGAVCALSLIAGSAPAALAQPDGPTPAPGEPQAPPKQVTDADLAKAQQEDQRPWAKGVSPDQQRTALSLFNEGNQLLRESIFPKAVEKYKEALAHWDHPAIHYNLALALVNLDKPVEMHASLVRAMAFGAPPLGEDKFARAKDFKLLVEKQLANVEYTVSVAGAKLIFDGEEVLTGPGTWSALVRAGEHQVAARAAGYVPTQLNPKLGGGETSRLELKLFTDAELTREKRKMPVWVPYSVLGAGVVIAGVGALLHTSAKSSFEDYDKAVRECAAADPTGGCSMRTPTVLDLKSSAETSQTMAFTAYALGGIAVATGVALVVINRPSAYRIDPFAEDAKANGVAWTPLLGPDLAGLSAAGRF